MKKIVSLLLLSIVIPQLAMASQVQNLKTVLDNYTYSMEVEWDQKDQSFANLKRKELINDLNLIVERGITKEELSEAAGVDLDAMAVEIQQLNLTQSRDVANFLIHRREFKKGANWVGDVVLATAFFTPIIVMIGFMIHGALTRGERLDRINACMNANPQNQDQCFDF